jgi:hypothetical protein
VKLSVNCMTRGPADRVAAMLALFRPVADEIFVAIDDRAEPELDAALATVADTLVRYPYAEPVDRPLAWIHAQCRGEWVLTVDDDEIPSRALLDALPELVQSRDCTHYWLRRRWLYPTGDRYIDAQPWHQDYQLRLVLNDPRLISFPDETHVPVSALGPARYLELPLYHADCVVNSTEARARKARHYERLRPGLRMMGRPLNEAFYLPEQADPATRAVPSEDLELIHSVLAPKSPSVAATVEVRNAGRGEIDRFWAGRVLSESAYSARLTLLHDAPRLAAGGVGKVSVLVENLSDERWPWGGGRGPEIRLTYRWLRRDGSVAAEGLRTALPADLPAGESQIVPLTIAAPDDAGRYTFVVDLVHEHVRWFEQSVRVEVEVTPARIVVVLDPGTRGGLLAALEQLDPDEEPLVLTPAPTELARTFAGRTMLAPAVPSSRLAFLRLHAACREALTGASRLLVPAEMLREGRRLPLLAALSAARSLDIPAHTSDGEQLTARRVLRR